MVEFIVNQDRNRIYPCKVQSYFNIKTVKYNGIHIGESIYMDRCYLGTFETYAQAFEELRNISNSDAEIYGINGYSEDAFTYVE